MTQKLHYKLLLLALLGAVPVLQAQWQNGLWTGKQAYNWYFGLNAGLNFETSPPTVLTDGQTGLVQSYDIESGEVQLDSEDLSDTASSSISDADGNLLFYTNGNSVWNANHEIMDNGTDLMSRPWFLQSSLIVPAPGNPNKYYIFTVMPKGHGSLLYPWFVPGSIPDPFYISKAVYSEVDMSLNGGLGAVTQKNIVLLDSDQPVWARIAATHHADGENIWVMFRKEGTTASPTNDQIAFLVTEDGVKQTPVVSSLGYAQGPTPSDYGQMKFSPDGTKLVRELQSRNRRVEVFNFDKSTGQLTSVLLTLLPPDFLLEGDTFGAQAVEFSPNSRYLYTVGKASGIVKQYDLEAGTEADIKASGIALSPPSPASAPAYNTALQVAPDGKIYVTYTEMQGRGDYLSADHHFINVINYPNNAGISAGFQADAIDLIDGKSYQYFPNFVQSFFASGILYEGSECLGSGITFSTIRIPGITAITWDFGDTASGADNASTELEPTHIFSEAGTYTVTATITSNNAQQTATTQVTVIAPEAIAPDAATLVLCADETGNATFNLTGLTPGIIGTQDPALNTVAYYASEADLQTGTPIAAPQAFSTAGQVVYAKVTNSETGCSRVISFTLTVNPLPQTTLPVVALCADENGSITVDLTQQEAIILGAQNPAGFTIQFYASESDVQNNLPVVAPESFVTTGQVVYATVSNNTTGCTAVIAFSLTANPLPQAALPTAEAASGCADATGIIPFDLSALNDDIVNNQSGNYNVSYYASEADMQANNAIANPAAFVTAGQTVYAIVTNTDTGCTSAFVEFDVTVNGPSVLADIFALTGCTPLDLTLISDQFETGSILSFYNSQQDALDGLHAIENAREFTVTQSGATLFLRSVDSEGCISIGELRVTPGDCTIPRGVSPNNDTMNDTFDLTSFEVKNLSIFNRYGREVYSKANYENEWEGQDNDDKELPTGTYYYMVELDKGTTKTGWVYLNRQEN